MKASFALANPMLTGLDWSFMLEISGETVGEGDRVVVRDDKEGEVVGGTEIAEDVVVIEEQV